MATSPARQVAARIAHHEAGHAVAHCSICDGNLRFPFLWWREGGAEQDLRICGQCCLEIKDGFITDLIQVAANVEIQRLSYVYRNFFLKRTFKRDPQK
jgi:hypothetical protein